MQQEAQPLPMTLRALRERLNARVRHQPAAVDYISAKLRAAVIPPVHPLDAARSSARSKPRIMSMILCGPSGCGKTEMAKYAVIDELGGEALPFVYIDASTYKDPTSVTRATGASAGFEGCSDGNSLPELLADLLVDPEEKRLSKLNKSTKAFKDGADAYRKRQKQDGAYAGPPLIYVMIDEIDKAENDFVLALNGLLDQGQMTSARGRSFKPSRDTTLLFIFTANYADDSICRMPYPHTETARALVKESMRAHGLQPCTIERFGDIVPFYPLRDEQLRDVLHMKLDNYLAAIPARFGVVQYEDDVKDFLVRRVARMADVEGGIRAGTKMLFENLDLLFAEAFAVIEEHLQPGQVSVFVQRLDLRQLERSLDDNLKRLLEETRNQMELHVYREQKESAVTALGVRTGRLGVVTLHVMSLPIINVKVLVQSSVPEVEAENRELRETLGELAQLDDNSDHYKHVQQILDSRRHLLRDEASIEEYSEEELLGELKKLEAPLAQPASPEPELAHPALPPPVAEPVDEAPLSPVLCQLPEAMEVEEPRDELKRKASAPLVSRTPLKMLFKKARVLNEVVGVEVSSPDLNTAELTNYLDSLTKRYSPGSQSPSERRQPHRMSKKGPCRGKGEATPQVICIDLD